MFIGCDGIFDIFKTSKLNNKFWKIISQKKFQKEDLVRELVDQSLLMTLKEKGTDNLTGIVLGLNLP